MDPNVQNPESHHIFYFLQSAHHTQVDYKTCTLQCKTYRWLRHSNLVSIAQKAKTKINFILVWGSIMCKSKQYLGSYRGEWRCLKQSSSRWVSCCPCSRMDSTAKKSQSQKLGKSAGKEHIIEDTNKGKTKWNNVECLCYCKWLTGFIIMLRIPRGQRNAASVRNSHNHHSFSTVVTEQSQNERSLTKAFKKTWLLCPRSFCQSGGAF